MKVSHSSSSFDAYKQNRQYAGEHLAYYNPTDLKNRPQVVTEVENGIFTRYLEKVNGQRDLLTTSSTKEKMFLDKENKYVFLTICKKYRNRKKSLYYRKNRNI